MLRDDHAVQLIMFEGAMVAKRRQNIIYSTHNIATRESFCM